MDFSVVVFFLLFEHATHDITTETLLVLLILCVCVCVCVCVCPEGWIFVQQLLTTEFWSHVVSLCLLNSFCFVYLCFATSNVSFLHLCNVSKLANLTFHCHRI